MRAVALSPDGRLAVVDKADPSPGPDEVVVAVERCGICGSDLQLKASGLLPVGAVMGHEFAGAIVDRGERVTDHPAMGQRVAVLPSRRCGTCQTCRVGRGHLCPAQAFTAIGLGVNDGAYADYVRVPAESCHPLPPHLTGEQGALVEPYAVALHAVARSQVTDGTDVTVGIVGAGPIGLMCLAALRRVGVDRITVAEPLGARAAVAEAMGATVVSDVTQLSRATTEPMDAVFDAAVGVATPPHSLEAVRPGGRLVLVGTAGVGQRIPMPSLLWVVREVDVVPSMAYTEREFAAAVAEVAAGAVDTRLLVPDVRPLAAAEQSFEELSGPDAPVKVMLAP